MSAIQKLTLASLLAMLPWANGLAEVRLPAAFGDHMVLQAELPLRVWGEADPGELVAVKLGRMAEKTVADGRGRWSVEFPPQEVSKTAVVFRIDGTNSIELADVLVGEVWIAAGQSNMEWPLKQVANAKEEIARSDQPQIRLLRLQGAARGGSGVYNEQHFARMAPEKFCQGSWQRCASDSAREFSAVAYFFGSSLHESLDVPVGIICPAIGGTPAEAWVRRDALASSPELSNMVCGNWLENDVLDEWCRKRARSNLSGAIAARLEVPGDDLGPYHSFKPGFMWESGIAPLAPMAVRGVIWYQGESNAESPRRVAQHQDIFETLVTDWREQWGRKDLPFLFVQLPALGRPNWPAFRQSQLNCLQSLRYAGMVV
ncbi:MAG: sialate O-acetylesterase, partial [Aeoliella sp.]